MTQQEILDEAIGLLKSAGLANPSRDARKILRHLVAGPDGLLEPVKIVDAGIANDFRQMIARRARHQPVAQIIGQREFWGRDFIVTADTLDPRPDSELIVETALSRTEIRRILDLGTGTGCLLLTLLCELPDATGLGTDISSAALGVAKRNARALSLTDRADFIQSDWFENVQGEFDLIISNPPYISSEELPGLDSDVRDWEPHLALSPGTDGLAAYKSISAAVGPHLSEDGLLILEMGPGQAQDVAVILQQVNLAAVSVRKDLNGIERVITARKITGAN